MITMSRVLLYLFVFYGTIVSARERAAFTSQPLPERFRDAPIYIPDTQGTIETSEYYASNEDILTYNPNIGEYTFWYTVNGDRYYSFFNLANKLKVHVKSKIKRVNNESYRYYYKVELNQDSPQPLRTFMLTVSGGEVGNVVMGAGWMHLYSPSKGRFMGRKPKTPWVLNAGESIDFSLESSSPPRYTKIELKGRNKEVNSPISERIPDDIGALFYSEESVAGIVLAPGDSPMLPPVRALHELLDYSEKYGWMTKDAIIQSHREIKKYSEDKEFKLDNLLSTISQLAGEEATEVQAMLQQIGAEEE